MQFYLIFISKLFTSDHLEEEEAKGFVVKKYKNYHKII